MTFLITILQLLVLLGLIYIIMVHAFVSTQTVWHEVAYWCCVLGAVATVAAGFIRILV